MSTGAGATERVRRLLEAEASRLRLELTPVCLDRLVGHYRLLAKWNRAVRLVGDADPEVVVKRHIIESLLLIPHVHEPRGSLLDIGSGNGYPAIPVKAALDGLRLAMLEPTVRKGVFLRAAVSELDLTEATVLRGRVDGPEDLGRWGRWDCISMRAVAAIAPVLDGAASSLRPSGRILFMVGGEGRERILRRVAEPLSIVADERVAGSRGRWILVVTMLGPGSLETVH